MSSFDEAVEACKAVNARMPPHLAAWLVAQEAYNRTYDQPQLGQALYDLMGGPGPEPLASIVARMVHPNLELRFPEGGVELRAALEDFIAKSGRPAGPPQVKMYLSSVASMPKPKDSGEWLAGRPQLDASGRVIDRQQAGGAPPPAAFEPPKMSEAELQLARAPRKPGTWVDAAPYRDDPGRRGPSRALAAVIVLAVLGAGAVAAFMLFPTLQRKLPLPVTPAKALVVSSTPEGAQVVVEGAVIGTTPYAGDNRWKGRPKLELRLPGYDTFRDSFEGGKDQSIAATLKKKAK